MSDSSWQRQLGPRLMPLQMVVAAMVIGCVTFLMVILAISGENKEAPDPPLVTYAAIAVTVAALLVRSVIPGIIVARGRRKIALASRWPSEGRPKQGPEESSPEAAGDAAGVWSLYSTSLIVSAGILEGATFLVLAAYLIEHALPALVIAVAMIFTLALHLPTRNRTFRWVEDQLLLLEQERQLGR